LCSASVSSMFWYFGRNFFFLSLMFFFFPFLKKTEFLAANLPKETKAKCNVWAKDYAQCQSNQVNALWNIMSDVLKTLPELRSGETKATAEHQAIFQLLGIYNLG